MAPQFVPYVPYVVPIMGMAAGIVCVVMIGLVVVKVAQSQIGQAIARRLSGKGGAAELELREEVHELRESLAHLEERLAESEERIDFTERLLARGKDAAPTRG